MLLTMVGGVQKLDNHNNALMGVVLCTKSDEQISQRGEIQKDCKQSLVLTLQHGSNISL